MSNFSLSNHRKSQFAPLKTLKKAPIVSRPTSDQKNMLKPKLEEAAAKIREKCDIFLSSKELLYPQKIHECLDPSGPKVISFQPPIQYRGASLGKILQQQRNSCDCSQGNLCNLRVTPGLDIEKNKGIVKLNNYINKTRNRDKIDIRKMIRRSAENCRFPESILFNTKEFKNAELQIKPKKDATSVQTSIKKSYNRKATRKLIEDLKNRTLQLQTPTSIHSPLGHSKTTLTSPKASLKQAGSSFVIPKIGKRSYIITKSKRRPLIKETTNIYSRFLATQPNFNFSVKLTHKETSDKDTEEKKEQRKSVLRVVDKFLKMKKLTGVKTSLRSSVSRNENPWIRNPKKTIDPSQIFRRDSKTQHNTRFTRIGTFYNHSQTFT
ncbi:unnamed protein product [Moneuplotes crassus]|uniref:Uncharacterized protein n=1 Tax=Euplotes crassus TaxID=5936 RepID=A0AAD1Y5U3_EUPCR|nr:unnamed protein product [Moneuplotes crassus]